MPCFSFIVDCIFQANISGDATTGTISDVDAFTEYSCTIRAVTVADGPASSTVVVTTLQACMTADHALMFCFTVCVNVHSFHSSNY